MHQITSLIAERIAHGLKRQTVTTPSRWALNYRVMNKPFPGKWTFKYHPWLKEMHDSQADINVGMKAAQLGFTEWALNVTFFHIDVTGHDCLYVLPSDSDAGDFSAGRFDPALEESPHLRNLFSNVRNVGHKRAGSSNLYIRGSRSRSKLKSIPTGFIVFDEVDEMNLDNIPLAMERASGQMIRQILFISTPTQEKEGYGIFGYFQDSTQEHYFFPCPGCSRQIELTIDNLKITADDVHDPRIQDSYLFCTHCNKKLDHAKKSEYFESATFVPSYSDRESRGFTINQLYSSTPAGRPADLAKAVLAAETDPAKEQELYNSKLALPHTVAGARIQNMHIDKCIKNYHLGTPATKNTHVHMGVDVGKDLYYEIDESVRISQHDFKSRILQVGTCESFDNLGKLMHQWGVHFCVVDRHPETRTAYRFALQFFNRVLLSIYGRGITGRQLGNPNDADKSFLCDRTSWLDLSLGRFFNQTIQVPIDLSETYRTQISNVVRHYKFDKDGNPYYTYVSIGPDHFAHARTYSELALHFAAGLGEIQNIEKVT